jgi:hypothetical protein
MIAGLYHFTLDNAAAQPHGKAKVHVPYYFGTTFTQLEAREWSNFLTHSKKRAFRLRMKVFFFLNLNFYNVAAKQTHLMSGDLSVIFVMKVHLIK